MSRLRTIYNSEALFVGPTPATGSHFSTGGANLLTQIQRVQSANHNLNITRENVLQFGELAAIDRVILEAPTVSLDFSYLMNDVLNEQNLGLVVNGSCNAFSGIFNGVSDSKNYFILEVPDGSDAVGGDGNTAVNAVHGIGNGYISSYSWEGQVNQFPRASVQVQAFNYKVDPGSSGNNIPAINVANGLLVTGYTYNIPTSTSGVGVSVLKPGDITLNLTGIIGYNIPALNLQSFTLQVQLQREPISKLGSKFPFARVIRFPVNATLQSEAVVSDLVYGDLVDVVCNDAAYNLSINMNLPTCSGNGTSAIQFNLIGAKLDSQSATANLTANNTLQLNWLIPIGGPSDFAHSLTISGITN